MFTVASHVTAGLEYSVYCCQSCDCRAGVQCLRTVASHVTAGLEYSVYVLSPVM